MTQQQVAFAVLIAVWGLWGLSFVVRRARVPRPQAAIVARAAILGIALQAIAYAVIWSQKGRVVLRGDAWWLVTAFGFGVVSLVLIWWAIPALGKQWRVQAGLNADHELIQAGPYRLVRHPIYASMLALFLCTGLLLTPWPRFGIALVVFLIGQEIRVRAEERLLLTRFGKQYEDYRKRVWAYMPFIR